MFLWEREVLLTTFLSWKRYTSKEWKVIEFKSIQLGNKFVVRYCFQRWQKNQEMEAQIIQNKSDIISTKRNEGILQLHFSKWFSFSRSRGKRVRSMRGMWNQWRIFVHHRKRDLRLLKFTMRSLQFSRKAHILFLWKKARMIACKMKQHFINPTPKLMYLLSLWIRKSPILLIASFFKAVSCNFI